VVVAKNLIYRVSSQSTSGSRSSDGA
jgi:hypothetical protein